MEKDGQSRYSEAGVIEKELSCMKLYYMKNWIPGTLYALFAAIDAELKTESAGYAASRKPRRHSIYIELWKNNSCFK